METIAVVFGGRSAEHDVSIVTGLASIIKPLELTRKYRVEAVYVAKDGSWHWGDKLKDIKLFTAGHLQDFLHKDPLVSVQFDGGMTLVKSSGIAGRKTTRKIDLVFPAMHGTYGEDGSLMGLLDMAGVPYVGCGLNASVLAMDKVLAKLIVEAHGMPVAKFQYFPKSFIERDVQKVVTVCTERLKFPLFVKPAHLGSSIGITRVMTEPELRNALEVAAHYDDKVLAEQAIPNLIEVTLPVMGNDAPQPALLERPLMSAEDFFDFDTKYMQGGKKGGAKGKTGAQGYSELPAKLSPALYKKAEAAGLEAYRALGCTGTARIDMLIDSKTNTVYFNEANPLPGSLYAHNWNAAGISNVELVDKLIALAKERHTHRKALATTFTTSYLQQF
jgi:D-alanine-D-alanine ligase